MTGELRGHRQHERGRPSRAGATALGVLQVAVAIACACVGYSAGIARFDARVSVVEVQLAALAKQNDETLRKLDRISSQLGAGAANGAALRVRRRPALAPLHS